MVNGSKLLGNLRAVLVSAVLLNGMVLQGCASSGSAIVPITFNDKNQVFTGHFSVDASDVNYRAQLRFLFLYEGNDASGQERVRSLLRNEETADRNSPFQDPLQTPVEVLLYEYSDGLVKQVRRTVYIVTSRDYESHSFYLYKYSDAETKKFLLTQFPQVLKSPDSSTVGYFGRDVIEWRLPRGEYEIRVRPFAIVPQLANMSVVLSINPVPNF